MAAPKTRLHFVLNGGRGPNEKLADVEIRFLDGLLAGMRIIGISLWKSKSDGPIVVHFPAKTYQAGESTMYYHFLKPLRDGDEGKDAQKALKDEIRREYDKVMEMVRQSASKG